MDFKPYVIIPIYNHGATIADVVERVRKHDIPVIVVDDGSDAETKSELKRLEDSGKILLDQLPVNQGKGAAVTRALRLVAREGGTHALQIDADAQHNTDDIPRFVAAAREGHEKVIAGYPVYDESVPRKRLYGRYITNVWVWIETLSFAIRDGMCGYRVYPVQTTLNVIENASIGSRMVFDTEVLVRLAWKGVKFTNIPTNVTYPVDGVSHFNMLRDNFQISWMHTKLFFGMLLRAPLLIARKFRASGKEESADSWHNMKEAGSYLPFKLLLNIYRFLGERVVRLFLPSVIFFYFLLGRKARAASTLYLNQLNSFEGNPERNKVRPTAMNIYRHFYAFGEVMLFKFSAWLGRINESDIEVETHDGFEAFRSVIESKRGAVLVGSHLGNIEMLRAFATLKAGITINGLTHTGHAAMFNRVLSEVNPASELNLIEIKDVDIGTSMLLKEKLEKGELLVITADRLLDNSKSVTCSFLGRDARFPAGPFLLASILQAPIFFIFCVNSGKKHHFYIHEALDVSKLKRGQRNERLQEIVRHYASCMETLCCKYPLQWFNFFDYWKK